MKKILCYLAAGAVALGAVSCVNDVESSSVTEVRQAKAAQLQSIAELNKAQAEAAKTTANAEAALKAAQAEYEKAMAAYQQALADKTGAEAEAIRAQMKQEQEKFAIEIERIKAQAELEIAGYRLSLKKTEQEIADLADARIQKLFSNYRSLITDLSNERELLLNEQTNKLKAESGLVSSQALAAQTEVQYNRLIAGRKAYIEILNAHKEHRADKATIQPKFDAKLEEISALEDKIAENEEKAYNESEESLNTKFNEADVVYYTAGVVDGISVYAPILEELHDDFSTVLNIDLGDEPVLTYINGWSVPFIFLVPKVNSANLENAKNELEKDIRDYKTRLGKEGDPESANSLYASYAFYQRFLEETVKNLAAKKTAMETAQKAKDEATQALSTAETKYKKECEAWEAARTIYNDAVEKENEAQQAYDNEKDPAKQVELLNALNKAKEATANAQKTLSKAATARNDAKNELNKAWREYNVAADAYTDSVSDYESAQDNKVLYERQVTSVKEEIADYTDKIAKAQQTLDNFDKALETALAEQKKFVEEILSLAEARDKAQEAYGKAQEDLQVLRDEKDALYTLLNNADVDDYEQAIADAQAEIARYTQDIKDAKDNASSQEESIKLIEKRIADIEAQIKVLETLADKAKAALDAALTAE